MALKYRGDFITQGPVRTGTMRSSIQLCPFSAHARLAAGVRPSQFSPMPCAPLLFLGHSGIGKFVNRVLRRQLLCRPCKGLLGRPIWFRTVCWDSAHLLFSSIAATREVRPRRFFFDASSRRVLHDANRTASMMLPGPKAPAQPKDRMLQPQATERPPRCFTPAPQLNIPRAGQRCADSAISR